MELIAKGAESNLYKSGETLIKERIKKNYRITEIDDKLRKKRTLSEGKILRKLKGKINVPEVIRVDDTNFKIFMKFIEGNLMKDITNLENNLKIVDIAIELGKHIAIMHQLNVIHNDLTTSNIIINFTEESTNKMIVYIIDFGLSFTSQRTEDKATDLVMLEHSLNTTGFGHLFDDVVKGYKEVYAAQKKDKEADEIFKRLKDIKKRVRYFTGESY